MNEVEGNFLMCVTGGFLFFFLYFSEGKREESFPIFNGSSYTSLCAGRVGCVAALLDWVGSASSTDARLCAV